MVLVKAGEFDMGSNDGDEKEMPVHKVRISRSYYIGRYHVTVAQFRAFADTAQYQTDAEKGGAGWTVKAGTWQEGFGVNWRDPGFKQNDTHPAVVVTWNDTQEFCKWASNVAHFAELRPGNSQFGKMRYTVRLPTEAEWEYAARGPQGAKYPWGDKWNGTMANVADASLRRAGFDMLHGEIKQDDGYPFTSPGGAYKNASWCGAYDMAGNAAQWCQDHFGKYSSESPVVDPQGPANAAGRVLRGGCWDNVPVDCRSARRSGDLPGRGVAGYGFRVVVVPSSRTP
ncbi:MAG: formylglycine-generating enzyme family protein [Planctomycetota bacterium]|nr:formylglycine-generating enzyme family protein [Planctomycetota bacterium]